MKKVWILEKFETKEEMEDICSRFEDMLKTNVDKSTVEDLIKRYQELIKLSPNGRWYGFDGKSNYRTFCEIAKASLRRNPNGKFRVVEAEIEDNADTWIGYNVIKENAGVLKYLMATK